MALGKSLCIINYRAGYEDGRRTIAVTDALLFSWLKMPIQLSHSICSLSCMHFSGQLMKPVASSCWQCLSNTDVLIDMRAFHIAPVYIHFVQAHSMYAIQGSDKISD